MNCLMSARSTKARSIAPVMFDVVRMHTFLNSLIASICVRSALTTRIESEGSAPESAEVRAVVSDSTSSMSTQTNASSSATISRMVAKSFMTSFPDSENHFENSEWALISTSWP
eukprot:Amastigsp_a339483_8.p5 type:complete len:114 gc:universal Amastigsp_a339483_8:118-459(+)